MDSVDKKGLYGKVTSEPRDEQEQLCEKQEAFQVEETASAKAQRQERAYRVRS